MSTETKEKPKEINARVITTSGSYPDHGHEKVAVTEPVMAILSRAANALNITDISTWVAKIDGTVVNTSSTYLELNLKGEVKIDFGPNEGGGG